MKEIRLYPKGNEKWLKQQKFTISQFWTWKIKIKFR